MGAARGVVRVRRDVLAARMTCPLCQGLLREATAITHCLHTFCRECIMEKINEDEVDCCPVCNIDLGCDPEEKLRPDHNLQDIRNKLFPIKKQKVDSPKAPTTPPSSKRKQRSLSSLAVDAPSVAKSTGLTRKRTKAKRRAAASASRATSSSNNGTMKLPAKSEGRCQKTEKTSALQSTKVATTAKKIESRDQKKIEKASAQQSTKAATAAKKNESRDQKKIEKASAQQLTKAAIAANKKQRTTDVEVSIKPSSEDKKNAKKADKVVYAARKAKAPRSTPKIHAAAEEQIIKKKGSELPTRKEETENEVNIPGATVAKCSNELSNKEETENEVNILRATVENNGTSSEPAPSTDQATTEDNSNQRFSGSASTLHDPITTSVWFTLVSSPNQKGALQLPELSKSYLRIKDGSLQVSFVQRYLAKKLDISDENEVEITCHGEPVSPSSTLHGLVNRWPRKKPEEPFPASLGAPAKEFVMVLGYRRRHHRHRPLTAALSPRHQTTSPDGPVKLKPPATATATAPPETGSSALSAPSIRSG